MKSLNWIWTGIVVLCCGCGGGNPSGNPASLSTSDSQFWAPFSASELAGATNAVDGELPTILEKMPNGPGAPPVKIGTPLAVGYITFKGLEASGPETSPSDLIQGLGKKAYFPIMVGDSVRACVEVQKKEDKWKALPPVSEHSIEDITKMRSEKSAFAGIPAENFIFVDVSSLNRSYLVSRERNKVTFFPLADDLETGFAAGNPIPGDKVIDALKRVAERQKAERPEKKPLGPG